RTGTPGSARRSPRRGRTPSSSRSASRSGGRTAWPATSRRTAPGASTSQLQPSGCGRCENRAVIDLRSDTVTQPTAAMRRAIADADEMQPVEVVSVENTHNSSGGRFWTLPELDAISATCRDLGIRLHLDGARLMNAAVASGVPAAEIGRRADTVTLCLSKGLGCPLGALVAGSEELMAKARRLKHLFGGAMRQAGIVAAAGVYALEHNIERLAEDH